MHFDLEKWLMDLFDGEAQVASAKVVCDENNNLVYGLIIDELGNCLPLTQRNVKVFVGIMANKENMSLNSFLQLNNHPIVKFVRIKENNIIKKMSLVINNSFDNIYKMIIIDSKGVKREVIDNQKRHRVVRLFAQQHLVSVSELEKMSFDTLEITKVNKIIEHIDVIVDEWQINDGPSVNKIIVTTSDGKKQEYSDIEDMRRIFIDLYRQEYPCFKDSYGFIKKIKSAYRSDFLKCVGSFSIINVIRPIYERIEIIERSFDCRLLPTKIRVVTSNHGVQVYDLVQGRVLSDTNYYNVNDKDKPFSNITKRMRKKYINENSGLYELEKHFSLLYKYMGIGEFELEKSFFVEYFAKQQLYKEGITRKKYGDAKFLIELQKMQKKVASDSTLVVSKVIYQYFEILDCIHDNYGREIASKIRVITNDGSFIINGSQNCNGFIEKMAKLKNCNIRDLLNNTQYVINRLKENKIDVPNNNTLQLDDKPGRSFILRDLFINNILHFLNKFRLGNFQFRKTKQKKVHK